MISLTQGLDAAIADEPLSSITFQLPWTARAFAIMLAASKAGHFTLKTFQKNLITTISAAEADGKSIVSEEDYYTCWVEALTDLLESSQIISDQQLIVAEKKVRSRLIALQHDHSHEHSHDHSHQHSHQHLPKPLAMESGKCR